MPKRSASKRAKKKLPPALASSDGQSAIKQFYVEEQDALPPAGAEPPEKVDGVVFDPKMQDVIYEQ